MSVTAERAGSREAVKWWAVAKDHETRMQALVAHRGRLGFRGLIALSDQQAAARRTWQGLVGLQATRQHVWSRCWRDKEAERTQRDLTDNSLRRSLATARAETRKCRELAFSRLTQSQYWQARLELEETSKETRGQERVQSLKRIENLERRERDC